jgi:Immunoglobulin domain/Immunoglobulin I-set domain
MQNRHRRLLLVVIVLLGAAVAVATRALAQTFTYFVPPTTNGVPDVITTGPDGALWFTENNGDKIGRITTAGVFTEFSILPASNPTGITTGPDGALWFTTASCCMGRITTAGVITEFPSSLAQSITAGPDGALWFTEINSEAIGRLGPLTRAPVVTVNPTNQTVNAGQTATFSAAASGTPTPTVQWQQSTDGGATFSNISGATSTTYSFTPTVAQSGYQYHAVFTNTVSTATTTAATLIVNPAAVAPVITLNPTSQTVNAGQTATFTAAASGTPTPTVQWQQSTGSGAPFTDIPGATSTSYTFTTTASQNGYQYRAVLKNTVNSATTTAATLTVNPALATTTTCAKTSKVCPNLWWFNGVSPQPTNYVTTLQAPTGGTDYTWTIAEGTEYAQFSNNASTIDTKTKNTVEILPKGDPGDGSPPMVAVTVKMMSKKGAVTANPFILNLRKPYELQPNTAVAPNGVVDKAYKSSGYESDIHYRIFDQTGMVLPFFIALNEHFTTGLSIDYQGPPPNWPRGPECGKTHVCSGPFDPNDWADGIIVSGNTLVPTPQPPHSPPGTTMVDHWTGTWGIGDNHPGNGVHVQTNTWQRFVDHGRHTNIVSPPQ